MSAPLRPVRATLRPTAAGHVLVVAAVISLVGAAFDDGVGLTVIAVLCVAFGAVAAFAAWHHGSALRILAPPPVTAFANERFELGVTLVNFARRATAFDVLFSLGGSAPGSNAVGALVTQLRAGEERHVGVVHRTLFRGVYAQGTIDLWTAFPLGLWRCRMRFALPNRIVVLPRLGTIRRLPAADRRRRGQSGVGAAGRGDEQEVWGIREWREGESLRPVHWKASARRGRLLTREFRSEPRHAVQIALATGIRDDTGVRRAAFEDAVSLAATLVEHQTRLGHPVRLSILGARPRVVTCRRGPTAVLAALRALAGVVAEPGVEPQTAPPAFRGERTFLVRVGLPQEQDGPHAEVTVLDVMDRGIGGVFDRRRRPGSDLLLGVRR